MKKFFRDVKDALGKDPEKKMSYWKRNTVLDDLVEVILICALVLVTTGFLGIIVYWLLNP